MIPIPFQTIDWNNVPVTEHPGEKGVAYWRTLQYDGLRIRMVEYSPGYIADHWCELGHIIYCIKGELISELADGTSHLLKAGMSYHVSDQMSKHRSTTKDGVVIFIVDGAFLATPSQSINHNLEIMMNATPWFEREFKFGLPPGMLPFFLERLSFTTLRLEQKVRNVSEKILSEKLEGKWSVKQNIGHLAEVDKIAGKRINEMISGIAQLSPAVFEPTKDYNGMPISEVIDIFRHNRAENLKTYQSLSEADLKKSSLHPRLKVMMNPVDLAMFDAEHDDHHLVRINQILNTLIS